jgi:large conductance mechanosensitive channel
MWSEFKAFLVKENVLALALAVIIGGALAKVVSALVADVIMPIVGVAVPNGAWRTATWNVGSVKLAIGDFAGVTIDFVIIAFLVWRISKAFIKPKPGAPVRACPFCKMSIDPSATRCAHCTSELGGVVAQP